MLHKRSIAWFVVLTAMAATLAFILWWLAAFVALVVVLVLFAYWLKKRKNKFLHIVRLVVVVALVFMAAIFLRLFAVEVFQIPSGSMESTLVPGDKILIEKWTYGPRTPVSPFEIPWVNLVFFANKKNREKIDSVWWEPDRLSGVGGLRHGDVIVFRRPEKKDVYFIKRCVGLPGDSLVIIDGKVLVNNKPETYNLGLARNTYRVSSEYYREFRPQLGKIGRNSIEHISDSLVLLNMTAVDAIKMKIEHPKLDMALHFMSKGAEPYCLLKKQGYRWNIDNFGPVWIPQRGKTIELTIHHYYLYRNVMNRYEKRKMQVREGVFYDGDLPVTSYTFQNDYCFVMGDNRNYSSDSRKMGFIPVAGIEGKARLILWSNENMVFRHSRFIRRIH